MQAQPSRVFGKSKLLSTALISFLSLDVNHWETLVSATSVSEFLLFCLKA